MRGHFRFLLLPLVVLVGCAREAGSVEKGELDDPDYSYAQQLKWRGRPTEALSYFLKVIHERGDDAPESYLNAGLIYLEDLQQPLDGYVYLSKYHELRPNADNSDLVQQRIDTAIRLMLRNLPAAVQEGSGRDQLELLDEIDRLRQENEKLQSELLTLRSNAGLARPSRTEVTLNSDGSTDPVPAINAVTGPTISIPAAGENPAAAPSANAPRTYTVVAGDGLWSIARKYYTDVGAGVERIREANQDQVQGDRIVPGMVLRIP